MDGRPSDLFLSKETFKQAKLEMQISAVWSWADAKADSELQADEFRRLQENTNGDFDLSAR
jgi:hypothetical protein